VCPCRAELRALELQDAAATEGGAVAEPTSVQAFVCAVVYDLGTLRGQVLAHTDRESELNGYHQVMEQMAQLARSCESLAAENATLVQRVTTLQQQLDSASRDRDVAVAERDSVMKTLTTALQERRQAAAVAPKPQPQQPPQQAVHGGTSPSLSSHVTVTSATAAPPAMTAMSPRAVAPQPSAAAATSAVSLLSPPAATVVAYTNPMRLYSPGPFAQPFAQPFPQRSPAQRSGSSAPSSGPQTAFVSAGASSGSAVGASSAGAGSGSGGGGESGGGFVGTVVSTNVGVAVVPSRAGAGAAGAGANVARPASVPFPETLVVDTASEASPHSVTGARSSVVRDGSPTLSASRRGSGHGSMYDGSVFSATGHDNPGNVSVRSVSNVPVDIDQTPASQPPEIVQSPEPSICASHRRDCGCSGCCSHVTAAWWWRPPLLLLSPSYGCASWWLLRNRGCREPSCDCGRYSCAAVHRRGGSKASSVASTQPGRRGGGSVAVSDAVSTPASSVAGDGPRRKSAGGSDSSTSSLTSPLSVCCNRMARVW
jgi:hypothetical protein